MEIEDKETIILLAEFRLLIKLMNKYNGTQTFNTPIKLYKDVFNPERQIIMNELQKRGVDHYVCESDKRHPFTQICNC